MSARKELSVVLEGNGPQGGDTLRVEYDAGAAEVDFISNAGRLFSCSLNDVVSFASLLADFVSQHRPDSSEADE